MPDRSCQLVLVHDPLWLTSSLTHIPYASYYKGLHRLDRLPSVGELVDGRQNDGLLLRRGRRFYITMSGCNIGALIIRIRFWGLLYYDCNTIFKPLYQGLGEGPH